MKILFIDTSSKLARVHYIDGETINTIESIGEKSHSVNILTMIDKAILCDNIKDVDIVSVTNGPGSYTGLRIALSTAKTLAYSIEKPLVCVNTLLYLAASNARPNSLVVPMLDARNNQAFYQFFASDDDGNLTEESKPSANDVAEICKMAEAFGKEIIYCGDGANNLLGKNSDLGNGKAAGRIVRNILESGKPEDFMPEKAEAFYLKEVHVTLKQ